MPKKILFFDHDKMLTGSTISMRYLLEAFVKEGYEVYVLSKKQAKEKDFLLNLGVKIVPYKSDNFHAINLSVHFTNEGSIFSKAGLFAILKDIIHFPIGLYTSFKAILRVKPDLIYINEYVMIHCALWAKLFGIPVLTHVRSLFIHGTFGLRKCLIKKMILGFSNKIFAITKLEAEQIDKNENPKLLIVPEFLDEKDFIESVKDNSRELNIPIGKKVVLMIGGVDFIKGSLDYLKAAEDIIKQRDDIVFVLAGEVRKKAVLKSANDYIVESNIILENKALKDNLINLGLIKDVKQTLLKADVLISTSAISHFSRPVIEAWAMKVPVIATNIIHNYNYISDGKDGLLYKSGNYLDLVDRIMEIVDDNKKAEMLKEAGYQKAKSVYYKVNIETIMNETRKLIGNA